ncbi:hypothetical protein ISF_07310 [Cordyceps fumosorosea ARSEF 2679]|uniref:Uncharacterized protein n=1 Tax=Cordyceps fumosorosea (strain ARSEF 2679) TaxID=1081104 RepID=A0A167PLU2_CORFA|nr:hypothetical protein ISF_07310 [Cordyceps fumosorosea ARSEF 2679]OAA56794.1 hypothetical protein ISF_07310 [Cordyceps fumosorosea ARSEF 2679]
MTVGSCLFSGDTRWSLPTLLVLATTLPLHKYGSYIAQANDVYYSFIAARKAFCIISKDWMSVGHSQGGAAVWKLSESGLVGHDNHFLGTVSLAPAARLWSMFQRNLKTEGAFLGYAPYHAKALQRVFPDYNLTLCFNGLMSISADLTSDEIVSSTGLAQDNAKFQQWKAEMGPATAGHRSSNKPVLVVQGLNDTAVLAQSTREVYENACKIGSEVHLVEYMAMEHSPVIAASEPAMACLG